MASLSRWWRYPRGLPDLYSYRSATYGDGLCLPIAAGALYFASAGIALNRVERALVIGAVAAGTVAGIAIQFVWLSDPHPRLNWTLTSPGHFNLPGWYHAAFLVGASGLFSGLWTRVGIVLARTDIASAKLRDAKASSALAGTASVAFLALLVSDNQQSASTASTKATTVAVAIATAALGLGGVVLNIVRRRRLVRHLSRLLDDGQQTDRRGEE